MTRLWTRGAVGEEVFGQPVSARQGSSAEGLYPTTRCRTRVRYEEVGGGDVMVYIPFFIHPLLGWSYSPRVDSAHHQTKKEKNDYT